MRDVPTEQLQAETAELARSVDKLTADTWDAAQKAFASTVLIVSIWFAFLCLAFALPKDADYGSRLALMIALAPLLFGIMLKLGKPIGVWQRKIEECRNFTADMDARAAELMRRKAEI